MIKNFPRQTERARATGALHKNHRRRRRSHRPRNNPGDDDGHTRPRAVTQYHVRFRSVNHAEGVDARRRRGRSARRPGLPNLSRSTHSVHIHARAVPAHASFERQRFRFALIVRIRDDVRSRRVFPRVERVQQREHFSRVSTASEDDERAQSRFRRPSIAKRRGGVADEDEGEVDEGEDEDDETDAHRSRRLCEDWSGMQGLNMFVTTTLIDDAVCVFRNRSVSMMRRGFGDATFATCVVVMISGVFTTVMAHTDRHHHRHHHDSLRNNSWNLGDASHAVLASITVSAASLVACALIPMRAIGVRVEASMLNELAIGSMLADALAHQLPSVYEASASMENGTMVVAMGVIVGLLAFHQLEVYVRMKNARDRPSSSSASSSSAKRAKPCREISPSGWLNLIADGLHNVTDGIVIAAAFARRGRVDGWATTWAALAHELPQEIGDYGVLRFAGFTDAEALGFNFLSALLAVASVIGTFAVFSFSSGSSSSSSSSVSGLFLESFAAGGFIAVALGSLAEIASRIRAADADADDTAHRGRSKSPSKRRKQRNTDTNNRSSALARSFRSTIRVCLGAAFALLLHPATCSHAHRGHHHHH